MARQGSRYDHRRAVGLQFGDEREAEEVILGVAFLLPAVGVQVLAKVPFAEHETDAAQGQAKVTRRFEVIARQDAQTTGINGYALVDAELHREVRNLEILVG